MRTPALAACAAVLFVLKAFVCLHASNQVVETEATPETDARVRRALHSAGLKFEINPQGNYVLDFEFDDKRRQRVFIRSETCVWAGLEIREIASYAYKGSARPLPETCEKLLKENARKKLGAWEFWDEQGVCDLVFVIKIPADADAETIQTTARGAAAEADAIEKILFRTDDL